MNRGYCLLLLLISSLLILLVPQTSGAQETQVLTDPLLIEALAKIKPNAKLDVTLQGGDRLLGYFGGVKQGQLLLTSFEPPARNLETELEQITLIRQEKSGAGHGFAAGFPTGAILGGSLFTLWGVAISSLDGDSSDDTMGIIGAGVVGVLGGGLALGTVGAGIGALTSSWYTIYEGSNYQPSMASERASAQPGDSRLNLALGMVWGYRDEVSYEATGLYGQSGLQLPVGLGFELGPEIGYYDLSGHYTTTTNYSTYTSSVGPVVSFGLATTWQKRAPGWRPYLAAGTGYYIAGSEFLGLSLGGGVCYRTAGKQEFKFEIRDHINIYSGENDFSLDYFITAGAVFTFDL